VVPGTLFEEFGLNYIGPIDGHDLESLIPTLQNLKQLPGPQFLHVVTRKGQGYKLAEADPVLYHGPGKFDPNVGITKPAPSKPTYTQVFGDWLVDVAAIDPRVVGITPAMREGSGLVRFEQEFPDRYFDVGIAEQHAVTFAAGLACDGMKPVVAIYSTFLQRAYDQLIHDVALQNLPVVFALDRGGLVGADGATHHGAFDLSYLRCIPNMVVMTPSDENECRQMLYTALQLDGPAAVRYPRGTGPGVAVRQEMSSLPLGRGLVRRSSKARSGHRIARLWFNGGVGAGRSRGVRRDRRRHALRQAAGYCAGAAARALARRVGDAGRKRCAEWSGQCRPRSPGSVRPQGPGAAARTARSLHRPWRLGIAAEGMRPRRSGRRGRDPAALRRNPGAAATFSRLRRRFTAYEADCDRATRGRRCARHL
jgi:Transketolase, pyrimidine binding domain/1-deoxy-D-xylulose-5-phosphate synthase